MQFPTTNPVDDPLALWALQLEPLGQAETLLAPKDQSKKVYQPQFTDHGPNLRNTPNRDGAFVELSRAVETDWAEAVFEMAHETVHLLNPVAGYTNNLEEGVAVAFSLHVQPAYGISVRPGTTAYDLACRLPGGPLAAGRRARLEVGALSAAKPETLCKLFPELDPEVAVELTRQFGSYSAKWSQADLNQSQGGMCICRKSGTGLGVSQEGFGP